MKNLSTTIKDLLIIINRQEKQLKLKTAIIHEYGVEIEQLKGSLKESKVQFLIMHEMANKSIEASGEITKMMKQKFSSGGNNQFLSGNN